MAKGYRQGKFQPRHPKKYIGDVSNIVYRSSWELKFCEFLDNNANILEWGSEEVAIPYIKPTDGRVHKYYVDFYIKYRNKNGEIVRELIEIKPKTQIQKPTTKGKRKSQQIFENITYAINVAKWKAATEFCNKHQIKFRLLTEAELFR